MGAPKMLIYSPTTAKESCTCTTLLFHIQWVKVATAETRSQSETEMDVYNTFTVYHHVLPNNFGQHVCCLMVLLLISVCFLFCLKLLFGYVTMLSDLSHLFCE